MTQFIDMTSGTFGRLRVTSRADNAKRGLARWHCVCDCGRTVTVNGADLRNGHTRSCGCAQTESIVRAGHANATHGMSDTRLYSTWRSMLARCRHPRHPSFQSYGARGIDVCQRWMVFENFVADIGHSKPSARHSLDRIDNDKGYEPGNVRWALPVEQQNNRRDTVRIQHRGEILSVSQWARKRGITAAALAYRLKQGWPIADAIDQPAMPNRRFL